MSTNITGPITADFLQTSLNGYDWRKATSCATQSNSVLQLSLIITLFTDDVANHSGLIQGDSLDNSLKQYLNVGWRQCTDQELSGGNETED